MGGRGHNQIYVTWYIGPAGNNPNDIIIINIDMDEFMTARVCGWQRHE